MPRHARFGHAGHRQLPAARLRRLPRHTGHRQLHVEQQLLAARGGGYQQATQGTRTQGTRQLPTARRRRVPARCTVHCYRGHWQLPAARYRWLPARYTVCTDTQARAPAAAAARHRGGYSKVHGTPAATSSKVPAATSKVHCALVHCALGYTVHRQCARMRHRVRGPGHHVRGFILGDQAEKGLPR